MVPSTIPRCLPNGSEKTILSVFPDSNFCLTTVCISHSPLMCECGGVGRYSVPGGECPFGLPGAGTLQGHQEQHLPYSWSESDNKKAHQLLCMVLEVVFK